jgi:hypothetical protein
LPGRSGYKSRGRSALCSAPIKSGAIWRPAITYVIADIGVVALGSTPPRDTGKVEWDGAAIALIETKSKK